MPNLTVDVIHGQANHVFDVRNAGESASGFCYVRLSTSAGQSWLMRLAPLPPNERVDANRVRGCVSVVWLVGEIREERCYFRGDAESPVVRGLVVHVFPPAAEPAIYALMALILLFRPRGLLGERIQRFE